MDGRVGSRGSKGNVGSMCPLDPNGMSILFCVHLDLNCRSLAIGDRGPKGDWEPCGDPSKFCFT